MSKLHRYRILRWPHDARTAIFRWLPDFLTSDGDRQVPRQSPLDDLPIAVGSSAEILVILKVNRAATEQSPGSGRQTSGAWLLRPGSRSKKSGDHLPMPQNRNRRKIGGSPRDSKSLWRRLKFKASKILAWPITTLIPHVIIHQCRRHPILCSLVILSRWNLWCINPVKKIA